MSADLTRLSKTISHALRHEPQAYKLTLDKEGWVSMSDLVAALGSRGWKGLQPEDIHAMLEKAEKKRFQILGNKIRAFYGHSTEEKIIKQQQTPPDILYHGTNAGSIDSIMARGLLPMNRQYVHLSTDTATAETVAGRRKKHEVCILTVLAGKASDSGITFYREENGIWLSEPIPPEFIEMQGSTLPG